MPNIKITRFYGDTGSDQLELKNDYIASLSDLTSNSKPLINTLSIVAGENRRYGKVICEVIESHILKVQYTKLDEILTCIRN